MDNKKVNENIIEGRNAVLEAFRSGKPVDKLYVLDGCQDWSGPHDRKRSKKTRHNHSVCRERKIGTAF